MKTIVKSLRIFQLVDKDKQRNSKLPQMLTKKKKKKNNNNKVILKIAYALHARDQKGTEV